MSAYQHHKQHNIYWPAVFAIGLSSALTAFGTARLAAGLSGTSTGCLRSSSSQRGFECSLKAKRRHKKNWNCYRTRAPQSDGIGLASGVVSALAGVGGGVITIPMMYYFLKMPFKLTIGTSSATVIITAFFSVAGYILSGMNRVDLPDWSLGFVDLQRGIALIIGTLLLARVGAYVSFRTPPYRLRIMFALFIISLSVYMLLK
jgi:uncharacterized membrane protein YfcA